MRKTCFTASIPMAEKRSEVSCLAKRDELLYTRKQGIMQSDLYQQMLCAFAKENRLANAKKIDKAK